MILLRQLVGAHWIAAGAISATLVAVLGWDSSRKARWVESGRQEVRVEAERKGQENEKKADAARRTADRLPAGRVFDRHCRDCN